MPSGGRGRAPSPLQEGGWGLERLRGSVCDPAPGSETTCHAPSRGWGGPEAPNSDRTSRASGLTLNSGHRLGRGAAVSEVLSAQPAGSCRGAGLAALRWQGPDHHAVGESGKVWDPPSPSGAQSFCARIAVWLTGSRRAAQPLRPPSSFCIPSGLSPELRPLPVGIRWPATHPPPRPAVHALLPWY